MCAYKPLDQFRITLLKCFNQVRRHQPRQYLCPLPRVAYVAFQPATRAPQHFRQRPIFRSDPALEVLADPPCQYRTRTAGRNRDLHRAPFNHISHPTAKDYRRYGVERREEALKATGILGIKEHNVIFLGFPDGGLSLLLSKFRKDPLAYKSPFTEENHPPIFEEIIPHTDYTAQDLNQEIERVIVAFRPTLVATTPAGDWHPDHRASYFFVEDALGHWNKKHPKLKTRFLTFLIHYGQWPVAEGSGTGAHLNPPDNYPDKTRQWISFPLKPEEVETKRKAIMEYHTQMLVMGRFLMSFARSNELYVPED